MTPYRQRDLLLVPIPFSDLSSRKVRPVVVVSNDAYNATGSDLLVVGVTSNLSSRPYTVSLDSHHLEEGTLRRPSMVRADKLFSIDQRIVKSRFGRVDVATFHRIRDELLRLVDDSQ